MKLVEGRELGAVKREMIKELFWGTIDNYPDIIAVRYRAGEDFAGITYRRWVKK